MFLTRLDTLTPERPLARFAGAQSYRFGADSVELSADLQSLTAEGAGRRWFLQLWACDREAGTLSGVKVAELPVAPPLVADGTVHVEARGLALPPAGSAEHRMAIALASDDGLHDVSLFDRPERFVQPSLEGAASYRFDGEELRLAVDAVANPRAAENLSGSLSLELWALQGEYCGGAFEGVRLAAHELGQLAGQQALRGVEMNGPAQLPPPGSWTLVLMLREWSAAGAVTRDFRGFALPYVIEPANLPASEVAPPASAASVDLQTPSSAAEAMDTAPAAAPRRRTTTTRAAAATQGVSVNTATVAALAAVKGVGAGLAAAIVAARPYATLDELLRVKGIGEKSLARLRQGLRL